MKIEKKLIDVPGQVGQIETRVQLQTKENAKAWVVISHPHPLYGGTMNNKVVTTLERAFAAKGYNTVAYNFRGVGKSVGEYDQGVGEQQDLLSVINWINTYHATDKLILAGFSFGSYVSLMALKQSMAHEVCTVAPPVGLYDLSDVDSVDVPWVLIQGGQDEVVCAKEILAWAMQQNKVPDIYWRDQASHFFHGELIWLRKIIEASY